MRVHRIACSQYCCEGVADGCCTCCGHHFFRCMYTCRIPMVLMSQSSQVGRAHYHAWLFRLQPSEDTAVSRKEGRGKTQPRKHVCQLSVEELPRHLICIFQLTSPYPEFSYRLMLSCKGGWETHTWSWLIPDHV